MNMWLYPNFALKNSFIVKTESEHYNYLKERVKENKAVVSFDFAENYAFLLHDEALFFSIRIYLKDSNGSKFENMVCISECLKHDTVFVHLFMKKIILFLKFTPKPD